MQIYQFKEEEYIISRFQFRNIFERAVAHTQLLRKRHITPYTSYAHPLEPPDSSPLTGIKTEYRLLVFQPLSTAPLTGYSSQGYRLDEGLGQESALCLANLLFRI